MIASTPCPRRRALGSPRSFCLPWSECSRDDRVVGWERSSISPTSSSLHLVRVEAHYHPHGHPARSAGRAVTSQAGHHSFSDRKEKTVVTWRGKATVTYRGAGVQNIGHMFLATYRPIYGHGKYSRVKFRLRRASVRLTPGSGFATNPDLVRKCRRG